MVQDPGLYTIYYLLQTTRLPDYPANYYRLPTILLQTT